MKSLPIPPAVYETYRRAAALLAKIMGSDAPDAAALIQHELKHRDPRLIADDFLLSIRWRRIQRQRGIRSLRKITRGSLSFQALQRLKACAVPADPSRN